MVNLSKKSKVISLLAAFVMLISCFAGLSKVSFAETYFSVLVDIEDVLTDEDETALRILLDETANKAGFNVGVIFSNDLKGMSAREYTEKKFDEYFGEKTDGIMLMINGDMNSDRLDWISAEGKAESFGTKSDKILESVYEGLNTGGFLGAAANFCNYLNNGKASSENAYRAVLSDLDDKLSDSEETEVLSKMLETASAIECNVGVVITSDLNGKSDRKYADDFLDETFTFGSSSIVLLYNNDRSNMDYVDWISTCGRASDLYDARIDRIFDDVYDGLDPDDDYARSIRYFCNYLENHTFDTSGNYQTYTPVSDYEDAGFGLFSLIVPCIFGLIMSLIITSCVAAGYKKKSPVSAATYLDSNRTKYTRKNDIFVNEFTTHHTVSQSSGGGHHSGGGGHHSSSHHSHGGGGGRRR